MNEAIADTSFVVAVGNEVDAKHRVCSAIYEQYETMTLPQSALAEVMFMLRRAGGSSLVIRFLYHLPDSRYRLLAVEPQDILRTAQLLRQYHDARLDFVDASLVAVAERLNVERILTLDRRDFQIVRPTHVDHFTILPLA